ncbi:MAG TPA: TonB-dependent receptor [Ohtaekwangia sp.]
MLKAPCPNRIALFLIAILVIISSDSIAQTASLRGKVTDESGQPVQYMSVFIKQTSSGAVTDKDGDFRIDNLPHGQYDVTISGVGYTTQTLSVAVPSQPLSITLATSEEQLEEVTVEGKSETQIAREQPIKADVVDLKALSTQPASMVEVMNRSAGIRIRQTGGLGSTANLMLNGFQGSAIKYFKDDVPMDYLGAGYNYTLVPVNVLDRVEVYKGVLPTKLGADALGGCINLVTKKFYKRYAEASYEYASFNTHRASLNVFYPDTANHFYVGGEAFYNHSDNNYEVTVDITDPEKGNQFEDKVRLFHNRFTHYYGEIYGGITNTGWADDFRISLAGYHIDRENQHGSNMSQAFGASTSTQYSVIPSLRYKKAFAKGRLRFDQFLVANTIHTELVDTARGTYDWYGNFHPASSRRGEITTRGSMSDIGFSYFISRSNIALDVSPDHTLEWNVVHSRFSRKGSDPLGLTFATSGRDILSVPAYYNKTIVSMGLQSEFLEGRIVNNLIGKFYYSEIEATDGDFYGNEEVRDAYYTRWGIAEAVKFLTGERSFIRISAEATTRLPEPEEIFGDGNLKVSNFELKPERSFNTNLGYRFDSKRYSLEVNGFYRITRDGILNVPYNFLYNRHENVEHTKGPGLEADMTYNITEWLNVNGNFTYQEPRIFDTGNAEKEGSRQRNTPYFFANLGANFSRASVLGTRDRLQVYWYFTFVREYYLDYVPKDREPDGVLGLWGKAQFDASRVIPNQSTQTLGFTYKPLGDHLTFGFQCKNIFNKDVFDNFKLQNAGRSFHLKATYTIQ